MTKRGFSLNVTKLKTTTTQILYDVYWTYSTSAKRCVTVFLRIIICHSKQVTKNDPFKYEKI